jgi:hypothetical protein
MGVVEELSVPLSLCCFALGAELEQIGEEWNDLSGIVLSPLRI